MSSLGYLLSAWIALEDITEEQGPPFVIPGSQKLPYYEFEKNRLVPENDEEYTRAHRFHLGEVRKASLEEDALRLRRGEFLLFHPALLHGARRILRPEVTRLSLQVYFASRSSLTSRSASYRKQIRGSWWKREERVYWNETAELLERDGVCGFQNPLKGLRPAGLSLIQKIRSRLNF